MRELPGAPQSDRWLRNRVGRITGSRMGDVMHTLKSASKNGKKGDPGGRYISYRRELITERITGRAADHYVTPWMERGNELEEEAQSRYEIATGIMLLPVGFTLHPEFDFTGASPDKLTDNGGIYEGKAPKIETLIEWREAMQAIRRAGSTEYWKAIPEDYYLQMQWEMRCSDPEAGANHERREFGVLHGYGPEIISETYRHIIIEVPRNDELIREMEGRIEQLHLEVEQFLAEEGLPPTVWHESAIEPPVDEYDQTKSFADNCNFIDEYEVIP